MPNFDFSDGKAGRPSVARIMKAWRNAGRPDAFSVSYGETEAEFVMGGAFGRWHDSGNGCRGVDRGAVVKALNAAALVASS